MSLRSAMSFIRRQYLVARMYTFDWWLLALVATTTRNLVWLGNLAVLVWSLVHGSPSPWLPLTVGAVLYLVAVYRGSVRQDLVRTHFPYWEKASRRIRRFDVWANPLVEMVHWLCVASAGVGRCIDWRGIRYSVVPGGQVREIVRPDEPGMTPIAASLPQRKAG
jgi:hypothetical protein